LSGGPRRCAVSEDASAERDRRWPGLGRSCLEADRHSVRSIEGCLDGDPFEPRPLRRYDDPIAAAFVRPALAPNAIAPGHAGLNVVLSAIVVGLVPLALVRSRSPLASFVWNLSRTRSMLASVVRHLCRRDRRSVVSFGIWAERDPLCLRPFRPCLVRDRPRPRSSGTCPDGDRPCLRSSRTCPRRDRMNAGRIEFKATALCSSQGDSRSKERRSRDHKRDSRVAKRDPRFLKVASICPKTIGACRNGDHL